MPDFLKLLAQQQQENNSFANNPQQEYNSEGESPEIQKRMAKLKELAEKGSTDPNEYSREINDSNGKKKSVREIAAERRAIKNGTWKEKQDFEAQAEEEMTSEEAAAYDFSRQKDPLHHFGNVENRATNNPFIWTPEYTQAGFLEKTKNSLIRGFGDQVIGGTGEVAKLFNLIPGWQSVFGKDFEEGNFISEWLIDAGNNLAENHKTYIPEELRNPEFNIKNLLNPDLWSGQVAEGIPLMIEMIFLSHGLSGLAKKGLRSGVKQFAKHNTELVAKRGLAATMNTTEQVATKGAQKIIEQGVASNPFNAIVTNMGTATQGAQKAIGVVGGGTAMNFLTGIYNAADQATRNREMKDEQGNPIFTDEEIGKMAAGTVYYNAAYLPIDMLSWGLTYARETPGLSRGIQKMLSPKAVAKEGVKDVNKIFYDKAAQLRYSAHILDAQVKPITTMLSRVAKASGKMSSAVFEGFEETFQETYETWAQMKAEADVTGAPMKYKSYWDYYNSVENQGTKTVSFALGLLGGHVGNITSHINESAERAYKLWDATENLKHRADPHDSEALQMQQWHVSNQFINNKLDGKISNQELLEDFKNRGIVLEGAEYDAQKAIIDEIDRNYEQAEAMNVRGKIKFMQEKSKVGFYSKAIETEKMNMDNKLKHIDETILDPKLNAEKKQETIEAFNKLESTLKYEMALATENVENLVSGKKAVVSNIKLVKDENGNTIPLGLTQEQLDSWYNQTDEEIFEEIAKQQKKDKSFLGKLGNTGKQFLTNIKSLYNDTNEAIKDKLNKDTLEEVKPEAVAEPELKVFKLEEGSSFQNLSIEELDEMLATVDDQLKTEAITDEEKAHIANLKEDKVVLDKYVQARKEAQSVADEKNKKAKEEADKKKADAKKDNTDKDDTFESEIAEPNLSRPKDFNSYKEMSIEELDKRAKEVAKDVEEAKADKNNTPDSIKELERQERELLNYIEKRKEEVTKKQKDAKKKKGRAYVKDLLKKNPKKRKSSKNFFAKFKGENIDDATRILRYKYFHETIYNEREQDAIASNPEYAKAMQHNLDSYLASAMPQIKYGPTAMHSAIAVNDHLRRMFPEMNIQVYPFQRLAEALGEDGFGALGYTIASAILIDERVWNQDDIFMHEFTHIFYELTKNDPETKKIVEFAYKNEGLVNDLKKDYYKDIRYKNKETGLEINTEDYTLDAIIEKEKSGEIEMLPREMQDVLNDELFANYLQGPLSKRYNKFFFGKEPLRQYRAEKWWKFTKQKATKASEANALEDLLIAINNNKPITYNSLEEYILQKFTETMRGNSEVVTVKGRASKMRQRSEEQQERINDIELRYAEQIPKELRTAKMNEALIEKGEKELSSAFHRAEEVFKTEEDSEDLPEEYLFQEDEDEDNINDFYNPVVEEEQEVIEDYYDKSWNRATRRFGKITKDFLEKVNGQLIDGKELFFNEDSLKTRFMELAKAEPDWRVFIDTLEQSKDPIIIAFVNYLNNTYKNPIPVLRSAKKLYENMVIASPMILKVNSLGDFIIETPLNTVEQKMVNKLDKTFINTLEIQQDVDNLNSNDKKLSDAAVRRLIRTFSPSIDIAEKVLEKGYLIYNQNTLPLKTALNRMLRDGLFGDKNKINKKLSKPLTLAIMQTVKPLTARTTSINAKGEMASPGTLNNALFQFHQELIEDIKGIGKIKNYNQFFKKYSVNGVANPILEGLWNDYRSTGTLPTISMFLGTQNEITNSNTDYKETTANEQMINEFALYDTGHLDGNYVASLDTFGNSTRRYLMTLPAQRGIVSQSGAPTIKGAKMIEDAYKIYEEASLFQKRLHPGKDSAPILSKKEFATGIKQELKAFQQLLIDNAEDIGRFNNLQKYYVTSGVGFDKVIYNELNPAGEIFANEFMMNRILNGFFMHNILNPNIPFKNIIKPNKGNVAPVIQLDKNLRVEMLPINNKFVNPKPEGMQDSEWQEILQNNSGQYITQETAERIQRAGLGVIEFKNGYKIFSHKIERDNPVFKNRAGQMKGYTSILTKEAVSEGGSQQALKPLWDLLQEREKRFVEWYEDEYKMPYDPEFNTQSNGDNRPKFLAIITPLEADKLTLFPSKAMKGFHMLASADKLADQLNRDSYHDVLDGMYYTTEKRRGGLPKRVYKGLDGSNFGPQQVMDKNYTTTVFSVQAPTSVFTHAKGPNFLRALSILNHFANQKKNVLQTEVLDELEDMTPEQISAFILKTVNKKDTDSYSVWGLEHGETVLSPHMADFMLNHMVKQYMRKGNNLSVPGTYAQTISDMGYKLTYAGKDAFVGAKNREFFYKGNKQVFIGGSNTLNWYGTKRVIRKDAKGNLVPTQVTTAMEGIIPKNQAKDTRARQYFYYQDGVDAREAALTYLRQNPHILTEHDVDWNTDKEFKEQLERFVEEFKIYDDKAAQEENKIGYYVPGELVMLTRIPHSAPSFMGVMEVVGFNENEASDTIVPSKFKDVIGADDDGDAMFIYKEGKTKNKYIRFSNEEKAYSLRKKIGKRARVDVYHEKEIDPRTGKTKTNTVYEVVIKNTNWESWNAGLRQMRTHWMSQNMRGMLTVSMDFETEINNLIAQGQEKFTKKTFYNNKTKKIESVEKQILIPNGYRAYKKEMNNTIVALKTLGLSFNFNKLFSILANFETELVSNGAPVTITLNRDGVSKSSKQPIKHRVGDKEVTSLKTVMQHTGEKTTSNPEDRTKDFSDANFQRANIIIQMIMDAQKNGHADSFNLNKDTVALALALNWMNFGLNDIYHFLNHPQVVEYMKKFENLDNPHIDSGNRDSIITQLNKDYPGALLFSSHADFNVITDPNLEGYNSPENAIQALRLINYLNTLPSALRPLSKLMAGHKELTKNPYSLQKMIKDVNKLLSNEDVNSPFKFFKPEGKEKTLIQQHPDIVSYLHTAEKLIEAMPKMVLAYNPQMQKVIEGISRSIVSSELNDKQSEHYVKMINSFIFAQLYGLNEIPMNEVAKMFNLEARDDENQIHKAGIVHALEDYMNSLEEVPFEDNEEGVIYNEDALSKSTLLTKALSISRFGIRMNPQFHLTGPLIDQLGQEMELLPKDLLEKLILYDLVANQFDGASNSFYSIFPQYVKDKMNQRTKAFINNEIEIDEDVLETLFERIKEVEVFNKSKFIPEIRMDKRPTDSLLHEEAFFEKIASHPILRGKIFQKEPFLVRVRRVVNNRTKGYDTYEITPDPNITKTSIALNLGRDSYSTDTFRNIENAKKGYSNKRAQIDALMAMQQRGMQIYKEASIGDIKSFRNDVPLNIRMVSIPSKKKKIGRAYISDLNSYVGKERFKTQKEFLEAYKSKEYLTEEKKIRLFLNYEESRNRYEKIAHNFTAEKIDLMTDKELIDNYKAFGHEDVFAFADILVPLTLKLTERALAEQMDVASQNGFAIKENGEDITPLKAWFQTNNIDSTHPATQAAQRKLEIAYKEFMGERRGYMNRIETVTNNLYAEKFGYKPTSIEILNKLKLAWITLTKNREKLYQSLYGNIVELEEKLDNEGRPVKGYRLHSEKKLSQDLASGKISKAEYEFAKEFREITQELHKGFDGKNTRPDYVPAVAMGRMETFARKGLLGVLANSKSKMEAVDDVRMTFRGVPDVTFKTIRDTFRREGGSNFKKMKEFISLEIKANKLLKAKMNEDGTPYVNSTIATKTILGDGMVNHFANQGYVPIDDFLSLDLNKALVDFMHTSLFVNGNKNFEGFLNLQPLIDGLLIYNKNKGFEQQNKFVRKVMKEHMLKGQVLSKETTTDKVVNALVKGNLIYIMGWQLFVIGKGAYALGNIIAGKYHNIKNNGGKAWITGEKRYWGISSKGINGRKAQGVLQNLNYMNVNLYDKVNIRKSSGIDGVFMDIALLPMQRSENWIQQVHYLGLLTEEQWNLFDDDGNYKEGATHITKMEALKIENEVKNSQGKGYSVTDQRMIQQYAWGRMIMQFSRFIPTMIHDRFGKYNIDIYGQEHIGSLRLMGKTISKIYNGELSIMQIKEYREGLSPVMRARFDSALRGFGMSAAALMMGSMLGIDKANELWGDANYYVNAEKLEYKVMPSTIRTLHGFFQSLFGTS